MRVYLCGPMRGCPGWNAAAFDRYAVEWEREGHTVLSPVVRNRLGGLDPLTTPKEELAVWAGNGDWLRKVISEDVAMTCSAEVLAAMPGWEASAGSTVEVALALFLGLPICSAVTKEMLYPVPTPWSRLLHMPARILDVVKEGGWPCI
jgi:hypothetical protein